MRRACSSSNSDVSATHRLLACSLLLLLSCCICLLVAAQSSSSTGAAAIAGPPSEVRVGVLAFFTELSDNVTNPGYPYDPANPRPMSDYFGFGLCDTAHSLGPQEWVAVKQAFRRINANSSILPHTNITWTIFDDQFLQQRGFFGALEAIRDHGAQFLMGASGSSTSQNAATVAQQYGMPILSWAASSPLLSDKRFYPTFMRVCHSDSSQSIAMAWISKYTFGIIYTNDLYGTSGAEQFAATTRALNMTLLSSESILKGGLASNFAPALARVAASGAKILIYFGQDPEWVTIMQIGPALGLFNNDTVWVVDDAIVSAQYSPEQQEQMAGVLGVAPDGGGDTAAYQQWATEFVDPASPWRSATDPPEEIFSGGVADVSFYSAFAADAASFAARALHELIYTQGRYSFSGADLQAQLAVTTLDGISGHIALDSNYDRVGVNFVLSNLQKDSVTGAFAWRSIGVFTDRLAMLPGAPPIRWRDGSNVVPSDRAPLPTPPPPPQSLLGPKQFRALLGLSVFGLCIIAALAAFLFVFRTTRVMHAASPVMLGVVLFGGMLVCLSVLLSAFPQGVHICGARVWLFNLGFTFSFGALLLKTFRVHRIFNNSKLVVQAYNDVRMLKMLGLAVGFDVFVLALRSGLAPYRLDEKRVCVFADGHDMRAATALTVILIVSKALAVAWGAWLSYKVRNLPQLFQESTYVALSIYNTLLLCAAWLGIRYGVDLHNNPRVGTIFESGLMLACGCITLLLIFAPKMLDVYTSSRKTAYNARVRKQMKLGKQQAGGGAAGASALHANRSRNSGLGSPSNAAGSGGAGGGNNSDSSLGGQTPEDIQQALLKVAATNRGIIDKTLDEIHTLEERVAAKKRDVQAATDLCYQIQCEQDYFNQIRANREARRTDMTDNDIMRLFEGRIADFNTANDKAGAGHLAGGAGGGGGTGRKNNNAVEMTSINIRKTNASPSQQLQAQQSTRGGGAGSSTGPMSPSASGSMGAMRAPGNVQRALPPRAAASSSPALASHPEPAAAAAASGTNASSLGEVVVEFEDTDEGAGAIPPPPSMPPPQQQQPLVQPAAAGSSSSSASSSAAASVVSPGVFVGSSARNSLSSTSEGAASPPPLSLSAASSPTAAGGARKMRMQYNPALATRVPKIPGATQMQGTPAAGTPASPSQSQQQPQEDSPPSI